MTSTKDEPKLDEVALDDLDRKILHWYLIDARLSYRELGHKRESFEATRHCSIMTR